jgi:hypothetical protein
MESVEVEIMDRLRDQFKEGVVVKNTAVKARDIWNKYKGDNITYCMCSKVQRHVYAKKFIEWYESRN